MLTTFRGPVHAVAFSPNGDRLATAAAVPDNFNGPFGDVTEWDPIHGTEFPTRTIKGGRPTDLAYSADGKRLLVVDEHAKLHVFPAGGPAEMTPGLQANTDWNSREFRLAVLSPDGVKVALVDVGGNGVKIYDTQRGWMATPAMQHIDAITALAFSPETNLLASASRDGTAKVWDVQMSRLVATLQGHVGAVTGVSFTRDGRRLATAAEDGDVRIWDPATGQEVLKLTPFEKGNAIAAVQFSPGKDDWRLAAAHGAEVRIIGPPSQ